MKTTTKIIADSINMEGARITTFEVTAPRFLLAEVNTHRVIAKSAASSRAIPVQKRIDMVLGEPFVPAAFGKNRPGMQAVDEIDEEASKQAEAVWRGAATLAAGFAKELANLEVHKQTANRILEPYVYYSGVMTATEWDNFFFLRTHPDAQPEFKELAEMMLEAYRASKPVVCRYHLPYLKEEDLSLSLADQFSVSAARCARVSYKTFDGKTSTTEADKKLCQDLIASGHLSPFDHPATTDIATTSVHEDGVLRKYWNNPREQRHLWGWIPKRVDIEREKGWVCARNSYDEILPDQLKVGVKHTT